MNTYRRPSPQPSPPGGGSLLKIHALSLSGSVAAERVAAGAARLTHLGLTVTLPDAALGEWRYFAGTDDERLAAVAASGEVTVAPNSVRRAAPAARRSGITLPERESA